MEAKPFTSDLEQAKVVTRDDALSPAQKNISQKGSIEVGEA